VSEFMTNMTGARPVRTTSPHDVIARVARMTAARQITLLTVRLRINLSLISS
jgi:hypothetical protein